MAPRRRAFGWGGRQTDPATTSTTLLLCLILGETETNTPIHSEMQKNSLTLLQVAIIVATSDGDQRQQALDSVGPSRDGSIARIVSETRGGLSLCDERCVCARLSAFSAQPTGHTSHNDNNCQQKKQV